MSSILTVSQLNRYVGMKIKGDTKLKGIAVKGEISNMSVYYKTGHIYFSLKDKDSVLKAVMFSSNAEKLKFPVNDGMSVVALGNIDVYERDGVYQIIVTELHPVGIGTLQLSLDVLKNKLSKLGVFDINTKKEISQNPKLIAVVTSRSGAALQDILNIIGRRCPICRVSVFPATVQGDTASSSISSAVKSADSCGADTIIIARGGGSSEDLAAFNEESVVMSIFNCKTPVISAIGHETDTTLADYAADLRVPTPSAAAELSVPDISLLVKDIDRIISYAKGTITKKIDQNIQLINLMISKASGLSPQKKLDKNISKLENLSNKLNFAMQNKINKYDLSLSTNAAKLSAISPFNVLERGYSIVLSDTNVVKSIENLSEGQEVKIKLKSGTAQAKILHLYNE